MGIKWRVNKGITEFHRAVVLVKLLIITSTSQRVVRYVKVLTPRRGT